MMRSQRGRDTYGVQRMKALLSALFLLCGLYLLTTKSFSKWDQCLRERPEKGSISMLKDPRLYATVSGHAALIVADMLGMNPTGTNWAFVVVFHQGIYFALAVLREIIGDTLCGSIGKANSISGHFFSYVFYALHVLTLPSSPTDKHRPVSRAEKLFGYVLETNKMVYLISATATLTLTVIDGYHTLRQCISGALFAVSAFMLYKLFFAECTQRYWKKFVIGLVGLAIVSALLIITWTDIPISNMGIVTYVISIFVAWDSLREDDKRE